MVAEKGPYRAAVVRTGSEGARRGPAVLPGCPAASLAPAALGSPKPGNKDTGSVLFSFLGAPRPAQPRGPGLRRARTTFCTPSFAP